MVGAVTQLATGYNSGVNSPKHTYKSSNRVADGAAINNFGILVDSKNTAQHQSKHSLMIDIKAGALGNTLDDALPRLRQRSPPAKSVPGIQLRYRNVSPTAKAKQIHQSIIKTNAYRDAFPHYFIESIEPRERTSNG